MLELERIYVQKSESSGQKPDKWNMKNEKKRGKKTIDIFNHFSILRYPVTPIQFHLYIKIISK